MKSFRYLGVALAIAAGSAFADDRPLPSFNDAPDLYGHAAFAEQTASAASRGASTAPAPMDYGPWIVIPSSGE